MRNILAVSIDITIQNVGIHDNAISITWESLTEQSTDDVLFNLVFSATQTGKLKESVNMNSSITKAEIYKGSDIEVMILNRVFKIIYQVLWCCIRMIRIHLVNQR